jgi:3-hydroxyisobutyrate dehydrogenase-like beta-hydroxyacid dehydrogenase
MDSSPIGIIGLGLVGNAIAQRLRAAGYEVVGFDVATERNAELTALGGRAAASAAEVFRASERVILSLPTSDIVRNVLQPLSDIFTGKTIVDTTTGDPEATDQIGQTLASHRADYLVATIAGSSTQVSRGEVIVMTGGLEELANRCDELLGTFSRQRFYVGSWLAAARMKLVVNLVLGLNRAVLAEGLSFAKACGIEPRRALEVLKAGPAFSRVMEIKGDRMVSGNFTAEARLAQHAKDVRLVLEQGEQLAARLPLSTLHSDLLARLIELGFGDEDNSAIIRAFDQELA